MQGRRSRRGNSWPAIRDLRSDNRLGRGADCVSWTIGHRVRGAYIYHSHVVIGDLIRPNDVRSDRKDDFILLPLFVFLTEKILQQRNFGKPGVATERLALSVLENASDKVDLTVRKTCLMLDAP